VRTVRYVVRKTEDGRWKMMDERMHGMCCLRCIDVSAWSRSRLIGSETTQTVMGLTHWHRAQRFKFNCQPGTSPPRIALLAP
jgi:hypothetical protein